MIRHYVLEIVLTIFVVTISIPIWDKLNKSDAADIASSYATMDYLYLDIDKYVGSNEFKDVVDIVNDTNTLRGYTLVVKINKENISKDATVVINNEQYNLNNLKHTEDKNYVYYNLKEGKLVADKENYEIEYLNTDITYSDVEYQLIETHEV